MTGPDGRLLDCQDVVEMFTAYLDGALDQQVVATLEAHLALCDGCHAYLDQLRTTAASLGALPAPALAPELRSSLLAAFRDAYPSPV